MAELKGLDNLTTEQRAEKVEIEKKEKQARAINKIIKGENDTFEKDYDIKELGLKFKLKVRFPNVIEQAKANAMVERYFEGLSAYMSPNLVRMYRMLSIIHICGVEVPSILSDDEALYNVQLLGYIASDFEEWMDTFHY